MRYEWEIEDIISGRVIRSHTVATNNKAILASDIQGNWHVIALSDGLVVWSGPKEELLNWLNCTEHQPTEDDRETTQAINWLRGKR